MHDEHPQRFLEQIRHYLAATPEQQETILRQTDDPALAAELLIAEALDALFGYWPMADRIIIALPNPGVPTAEPGLEFLGVSDPEDFYPRTPLIGGGDEESFELAQWLLNAAIRRMVPGYFRRHLVHDRNPGEPCDHLTYEVYIADTAFGPLWRSFLPCEYRSPTADS
jgi:hypothetical protein